MNEKEKMGGSGWIREDVRNMYQYRWNPIDQRKHVQMAKCCADG